MPISKPYKQIYIYLAALNFQKLFIDHTHTFPHTYTQSFHLYYCLQSLSTYIYSIISFVLLFTESFHIHLHNHFICIIVYRVFPHTSTQSFHLYYCLQSLSTYIYSIISFVLLFTESFHIHLRNHFICIIVYRVFPHTYTQSFHLYYCLQNLHTRSFYFFVFVCL